MTSIARITPISQSVSGAVTLDLQSAFLSRLPKSLFKFRAILAGGGDSVDEGFAFVAGKKYNGDGTYTYDILTSGDLVGPDLSDLASLNMDDFRGFTITTLDNATTLPAILVGIDPVASVALLKVTTSIVLTPSPLHELLPTKGSLVYVPDISGHNVTIKGGVVENAEAAVSWQSFSGLNIDAVPNEQKKGLPVFDESGNVVGMYAVNSTSNSPSNTDKYMVRCDRIQHAYKILRDDKGISYGDWGMAFDATSLTARQFYLPTQMQGSGLWVSRVFPSSAAADAGFQAGDIILSVDGDTTVANATTTEEVTPFTTLVRESQAGGSYSISVFRHGSQSEFNLTLQAQEMTYPPLAVFDTLTGFEVSEIPEIYRRLNGVSADIKGVIVSGSNLRVLRKNRIIVSLNGQDTPDVETFKTVFGKLPSGSEITVQYLSASGGYTYCYQCSGNGALQSVVFSK